MSRKFHLDEDIYRFLFCVSRNAAEGQKVNVTRTQVPCMPTSYKYIELHNKELSYHLQTIVEKEKATSCVGVIRGKLSHTFRPLKRRHWMGTAKC